MISSDSLKTLAKPLSIEKAPSAVELRSTSSKPCRVKNERKKLETIKVLIAMLLVRPKASVDRGH
jgi:hypothetical protein